MSDLSCDYIPKNGSRHDHIPMPWRRFRFIMNLYQARSKMQKTDLLIHALEQSHIPEMAEAFQQLGWQQPASQYERHHREQTLEVRNVYVARVDGQFAG